MRSKTAFAELAAKLVQKGRKPAQAAISLSPKARAAAEAASRKQRLLAQRTASGLPKYMEVPRAAYGTPATAQELAGGKEVAKQLQAAKAAREAEELAALSSSLTKGKTIGGFAPGTLSPYQAGKAVRALEREPFLGGATAFQGPAAKLGSFQQGFLDELEKIGEPWR